MPEDLHRATLPPARNGRFARGIRAGAAAVLLVLFAPAFALAAGLVAGTRTVTLVAADGARLDIGRVTLAPDEERMRLTVTLDAPEFHEEFLSMRGFRCLPDAKEMWCHLAYPYKTHGFVTPDDLTDLEYALLFIWRSPEKVGIDAWNGLYFKLAAGEDGSISGELHEADFNVLAVPPGDAYSRPLSHGDLTPAGTSSHRFVRVEIR